MKTATAFVFAFVLAIGAAAQSAPAPTPAASSPTNIYAAGVSYNNQGSPAIAGTALYARSVDSAGTYAFTVIDAVPNTLKPFTVTTNFSVGAAQKVFTLGNVPIFVPTAAGVSFNGTNTGWAWSTGGMASISVGKKGFRLFPALRVVKSSVSNGSGYQPIATVMFGWGQ